MNENNLFVLEGKVLNRYLVVRNYNDANILLEKGYQILKIDRDRDDRLKLIFLFENDKNILKELKNISNNKK